jgi:hypothetical protein
MEIFSALAGCVLYGLSDHALAVPPLEAFGQLPAVELVRISPSGERIALIGVIGDERRLAVMTADNKLLQTGVVGNSKVRDLDWAGDENVSITISSTVNLQLEFGHKYELDSVIHVGMDDKAPWQVFGNTHGIEHMVIGYFGGITEARDMYGGFVFDHGYRDLYRVDLKSATLRLQQSDQSGRVARARPVQLRDIAS